LSSADWQPERDQDTEIRARDTAKHGIKAMDEYKYVLFCSCFPPNSHCTSLEELYVDLEKNNLFTSSNMVVTF
jgi:hypothetical protein